MAKDQYPPTVLPLGDEVKINNDNFSCIMDSNYPIYDDKDKPINIDKNNK